MKNKLAFLITLIGISLFLTIKLRAQTWPLLPIIPPDTTTYYVTGPMGNRLPVRRPPDSTLIPGTLLIRFRRGVLDTAALMRTYDDYYYGSPHTKGKGLATLGLPSGGSYDPERGFPPPLRTLLFRDQFNLGDASNVIQDSVLTAFLISQGGIYLSRFTAASPIDTLSVTRTGDTIGCDLANWMLLTMDSSTNPLVLAYLVVTLFPSQVLYAEPSYSTIHFLRTPADSNASCGLGPMLINASIAWSFEVGIDSIRLSLFDQGVNYLHPDLGGGIGPGMKVPSAWNYSTNDDNTTLSAGHGTPTAGIMAALTNRAGGSVGIAGGWGTLDSAIDEGVGVSLIPICSNWALHGNAATHDFVRALFEASARSPVTLFGYGVHAFNSSFALGNTLDEVPSAFLACNYAFQNGVVQLAGMEETDSDGYGSNSICYPSGFDEPWMIAVSGCDGGKNWSNVDDYGWSLDVIAPSGDVCCPCGAPATLNWTTQTSSTNADSTWYGPFAGTSAATPNVTGSVGLLLSHAYRHDPIHLDSLEPEDYGGIIKASAWRHDIDHSDSTLHNSWVPHSGWGTLDIGNAFTMLDTNLDNPMSGYKITHVSIANRGADTMYFNHTSPWFIVDSANRPDSAISFQVAFDPLQSGLGDSAWMYRTRHYVFDTGSVSLFHAVFRFDTITKTITIPRDWDVTPLTPLFAWGRSGGTNYSGWGADDDPNMQTGWSRVISSTGGDSINEGIFHSQSRTFSVITGQFDVWSFDYSTHYGHCPPDSEMGVNFTIFGRVDTTLSGVAQTQPASSGEILELNPRRTDLQVNFFLPNPAGDLRLQIYDLLGRVVAETPISYANQGWNETTVETFSLPSGGYFCRLWGDGIETEANFSIIR